MHSPRFFYLQNQNRQYVCLFIWVLYFVLFFCFTVLRLEIKTLSVLNKHSHTELPSPLLSFRTEEKYTATKAYLAPINFDVVLFQKLYYINTWFSQLDCFVKIRNCVIIVLKEGLVKSHYGSGQLFNTLFCTVKGGFWEWFYITEWKRLYDLKTLSLQ